MQNGPVIYSCLSSPLFLVFRVPSYLLSSLCTTPTPAAPLSSLRPSILTPLSPCFNVSSSLTLRLKLPACACYMFDTSDLWNFILFELIWKLYISSVKRSYWLREFFFFVRLIVITLGENARPILPHRAWNISNSWQEEEVGECSWFRKAARKTLLTFKWHLGMWSCFLTAPLIHKNVPYLLLSPFYHTLSHHLLVPISSSTFLPLSQHFSLCDSSEKTEIVPCSCDCDTLKCQFWVLNIRWIVCIQKGRKSW